MYPLRNLWIVSRTRMILSQDEVIERLWRKPRKIKCLSTSLLLKFYYFHMHFNSDLYEVFTNNLFSEAF